MCAWHSRGSGRSSCFASFHSCWTLAAILFSLARSVHLAAGVLFGPFWGGTIAAAATLVSQLKQGVPWLKLTFNVAQRALCVTTGMLLYGAVGGNMPPAYLIEGVKLGTLEAQRDLGLFFVVAVSYFAINTVLLNAVVAISSGRQFRELWNLNAKGVFGYDIAASSLSILLAFVYSTSERAIGMGVLGFVAVLAPILVTRHVYGLYRRLQSSGRELLDLMVKAIEARDPYTSGHSLKKPKCRRRMSSWYILPQSCTTLVKSMKNLLRCCAKIQS